MAEHQPPREHARRRPCRVVFLATGSCKIRHRYCVRAQTIVVIAFVVTFVVVPTLDFHPSANWTLSSITAAQSLLALALARSRRRHKVVVARVLKQHAYEVFLFLVVFVRRA
ncbi:hypothetical protein EDB83DRAFT_2373752 [Lactarius deliciosus]|nr:hypothetical protein EDB83DRAFT_2373752 [Lactarius deliciosus]